MFGDDKRGESVKIFNISTHDLERSIVASGFPMRTEFDPDVIIDDEWHVWEFLQNKLGFILDVDTEEDLRAYMGEEEYDIAKKHVDRAIRLAQNPAGSGHNNFLSGILVSFNMTAPRYFWNEFQRYHHMQVVSSSSQVHRLTKMNLSKTPKLTEEVWRNAESLIEEYNKGNLDWDSLVSNMPQGIELTAMITTNYLQLKTMYAQRKNHKSKEWRDFCDWIKTLPMAKEFILND